MAYSAALNTIYNHYLSAYAPKGTTRYDAHKRSELKSIYNTILKLNKESPLYLPETNDESIQFAVSLKENARQLRNTIASLGGLDRTDLLNKKTAYSSNPDLVETSFIGDASEKEVPSFQISVENLASGQINIGSFLPSASPADLPEDSYSFDVLVNDLNYEFQYNIRQGETNRDVQERLARLISGADIGLKADVLIEGQNSALRLTGASTGLKDGQDFHFVISDDSTSKKAGSVAYFGLNTVTVSPSNAKFTLNGEPREASSNHFTIEKLYEVTLHAASASPEDTAELSLKTDVESLTENISNLIDGYNSFLASVSNYDVDYHKSRRLLREMNHLSSQYAQSFSELGISRQEDGSLSLDKNTFTQTALSEKGFHGYDTLKDFTDSILKKINDVSLNPMQYVEKTIVAYKNPGHNFPAPYAASAYSGMMFNYYC